MNDSITFTRPKFVPDLDMVPGDWIFWFSGERVPRVGVMLSVIGCIVVGSMDDVMKYLRASIDNKRLMLTPESILEKLDHYGPAPMFAAEMAEIRRVIHNAVWPEELEGGIGYGG